MIGVSAEINSPSVITSMIWSPNFPFPLGRNVVIASPRVPGEIGPAGNEFSRRTKRWPGRVRGHEREPAIKTGARQVPREQCDHDHRGDDCDRQVQHRNEQHFGRGNERLIGIAIDHRPEERGENEKSADHAKDDGGVGEEQHFNEDEGNAENKKYGYFPPARPAR